MQKLTSIDYVKLGIRGTPTVLLVDSLGTVRKKWAGQLPATQEESLLVAIRQFPVRLQ